MKRIRSREADIHLAVVTYLKLSYPEILFRTDYSSGMRMSMFQAVRHKQLQSCRAWPDIFIYYPTGGYHGLALELKRESPYKKDGTLKRNLHLEEQRLVLARLTTLGYKACFVVQFDEAKRIIDEYMSMPRKK
jgi:hypothetical protein